MVETINVVCPGCKKTFAVPAEYEDRKVKCKCGQVFIAAKKLTEPKEPVPIESARGKPSHNKSVIVLGVISVSLTLILSVFLMWLFVFRYKWGNDNSPKIRQQRLANMRATVNGGAWLTRKAGNSEPIRGLNIEVLNPQGKNGHLLAILKACLEYHKLVLEFCLELKIDEKSIESGEGSSAAAALARLDIERDKKNIESEHQYISSLQEKIRTISRDSSASVDMLEIQHEYFIEDLRVEQAKQVTKELWRRVARRVALGGDKGLVFYSEQRDKSMTRDKAYENIRITWEAICLEQAVGSTHTDVDGKYRIELPVGSYYLYAAFESEYSGVDWFIPLQVLSNEEIKVDFHNENASRIDNKDTSP